MTDIRLLEYTKSKLRQDLPHLKPGMRIRVWSKIKEGDKWRATPFEGTIIAMKHGRQIGATFTVRRIGAAEVGIERTWPLHSPLIEKIEILQQPGRVRRAKLYYLRGRSRRETRAKLRSQTQRAET